jgi:predicted TIM-barrel fold metal-dependent hydrolase
MGMISRARSSTRFADAARRVPKRPRAGTHLSGLRVRDQVGMERIMFETDYPHGDTSFPDSKLMEEKLIASAGLTDDEAYRLIRGNAIKLYDLKRWGISA